jgi:predicted Fe-S protein YdhL (DUF1289 family)
MTRVGPPSPCIGVCVLDERSCCKGCRRSVAEISRWARMSGVEQWAVIARLERVRADERAEAGRRIAAEG